MSNPRIAPKQLRWTHAPGRNQQTAETPFGRYVVTDLPGGGHLGVWVECRCRNIAVLFRGDEEQALAFCQAHWEGRCGSVFDELFDILPEESEVAK